MALFLIFYAITRIVLPNTKESAFRLRRRWLKWCGNPFLNIHVQVDGKPIDEPALYICNHRSFSDPVVLCTYLDAFVIAKAEVASYPVINKGAEVTGILYVQRENQDSRQAARDMMVDTIKSGYNVLVYPEGTVGVREGTLDFRMGTFMEAAKQGIPVVPVTLEYRDTVDLWQKISFPAQYLRQFTKWKTECKMKFGPVLRSDDGKKLHDDAYEWVNNTLSEMQEDWTRVDFDSFEKL